MNGLPDSRSSMHVAMQREGLSFRTLSFKTGLSPGFLCRVATGKQKPSVNAALEIAAALRSDPRRLFPEVKRDRGAAK